MSISDSANPTTQRAARLIHSGATYEGKQGLTYGAGVFADNVGASGICMHLLNIPPSGRAKAHMHANHETPIYLISGEALVYHGDGLAHQDRMRAGDFMYIPASVPHLPVNPSQTEPAVAVLARTDPNEQESVVLMPDLDAVVDR